MENAGNALNIVILDACRNNPFARSWRSSTNGLAQASAPAGTLIAYSTAPGSVASDGSSGNGLYTQELLRNMRTPGLGIEDVFKRVRIAVREKTQGRQTPWENSSLTGDFYFVGPRGEAPSKQNAATADDYNRVFLAKEVTQKAEIISRPEPGYTEVARMNGTSGTIQVRMVLSASGEVTGITPLNTLPDGLTEKAIEAARQV